VLAREANAESSDASGGAPGGAFDFVNRTHSNFCTEQPKPYRAAISAQCEETQGAAAAVARSSDPKCQAATTIRPSLTGASQAVSLPRMDPSLPNPYQAPSDIEPPSDEAQASDGSATRGARLGAAIIDGLISIAIVFPVQYWAGVYQDFPNLQPQRFPRSLLWSLAGVAVWLAVHGVFLARSAQTVGKKALGIQIVMAHDGKPAPFSRLVFWRFLPTMLVAQIPGLGPILSCADILFIFRKDRRCLHDHIAGTRVIALDASAGVS
jgi:uncharacterized RDD family membrane protein YckC